MLIAYVEASPFASVEDRLRGHAKFPGYSELPGRVRVAIRKNSEGGSGRIVPWQGCGGYGRWPAPSRPPWIARGTVWTCRPAAGDVTFRHGRQASFPAPHPSANEDEAATPTRCDNFAARKCLTEPKSLTRLFDLLRIDTLRVALPVRVLPSLDLVNQVTVPRFLILIDLDTYSSSPQEPILQDNVPAPSDPPGARHHAPDQA
jgi:hypothetical protein